MDSFKICAVVTGKDLEDLPRIESMVDLFELRIDMIGIGWEHIVKRVKKPWIACCRSKREGGHWMGSEQQRIKLLISASEYGANMVDIELSTENLIKLLPRIRINSRCLVSYHNFEVTPSLSKLKEIVWRQIEAGADVCKVVTSAKGVRDNITVLKLINSFPDTEIVSFAMGTMGMISRVLCPLVGGSFAYASLDNGKESASGQMAVKELYDLYEVLKKNE